MNDNSVPGARISIRTTGGQPVPIYGRSATRVDPVFAVGDNTPGNEINEGWYCINQLPPGATYSITATDQDGYHSKTLNVSVTTGGTPTPIVLTPSQKETKMMYTRSLLLIVLLSVALSSVANAQYDYRFAYAHTSTFYDLIFGTVNGRTAGYDGEIRLPVSTKSAYCGIYKQEGQDGWDGATGWYEQDTRPPINAGERVTENIYLWAGTLAPAGDLHLYQVYPPILADGMTYTLRLVQIPTSITYNGPTEWGPDHGTITLPFYATDNPLTGYKFEATITAPVPEPCALASLAVPCVGLTGVLFRLRKRRYTGKGSG